MAFLHDISELPTIYLYSLTRECVKKRTFCGHVVKWPRKLGGGGGPMCLTCPRKVGIFTHSLLFNINSRYYRSIYFTSCSTSCSCSLENGSPWSWTSPLSSTTYTGQQTQGGSKCAIVAETGIPGIGSLQTRLVRVGVGWGGRVGGRWSYLENIHCLLFTSYPNSVPTLYAPEFD